MRLLLLAGTSDARHIAEGLGDCDVIASLAGATRDPRGLPVPVRIGGFGGEAGFRRFLQAERITAVLDATHPYAVRITARTARICADLGRPFLQYLRPKWQPGPGDLWTEIANEEKAAAHIPQGATVFLGTGRQTLERFANLAGCRVICRQIDPPDAPFPFEGGEFLIGRPPFSVEHETELFRALGVDWLVVKNAGGEASSAKLTAARRLGLPVLMIARPPLGDWPIAETTDEAIAWAHSL